MDSKYEREFAFKGHPDALSWSGDQADRNLDRDLDRHSDWVKPNWKTFQIDSTGGDAAMTQPFNSKILFWSLIGRRTYYGDPIGPG